MEIIKSSSNKFIKEIKGLNNKKIRNKKGYYFIEGIRIVEDAIKSNEVIEYILYSDKLFQTKDGEKLFSIIKDKYINYQIEHNLFKEISDTETPQGIIAVMKIKKYNLEYFQRENLFLIFLDRIQDPGNMGTIIRSADALGADGIIISKGSVDIYNPKVVRSTMGSLFHIPIIQVNDSIETILKFKDEGVRILATTLEKARYCYDIDLTKNILLIIGNEGNGIREKLLNISDENIVIPMEGDSESLNASIASSIIMYEVLRQKKISRK
ncbi:23S rRNA (guanosine(2251)-2'-O)-methyltransferase RlmB [Clostridium sp. D2Q-14]|uniref:23S rRNA (guanosine(2251)-2'-O)-methyltransferase RlmB n=1 Tax=Anaeromonas gelatinilytica TaxID=2683194 RepID=UPI00193C6179|nr:23S rRNA (guanosine(2251)-2'-O)-methyltransferase RlmB [Anaeromonas gelatinilytica]MBS4536276.1 23S rRNA (guanosine(2251)-2'-O)-methyltransferase RlmB [Anaeromonas gelatinilytica]